MNIKIILEEILIFGIYIDSNNASVINDKVFDEESDVSQNGYDIGIANYGSNNSI